MDAKLSPKDIKLNNVANELSLALDCFKRAVDLDAQSNPTPSTRQQVQCLFDNMDYHFSMASQFLAEAAAL